MIGKDHVISGLIEKRRELAGIIDEMQRQLDQHRADLTHIDGVLRVLATDLDPEKIKPKRVYRRNRYFARNELSRLCLGVLRTAAGELLSTDDIAGRVIAAKGFDAGDTILRAAVREQVGSTVKRLHRNGTIENIGRGRASKWKLAGASRPRFSWYGAIGSGCQPCPEMSVAAGPRGGILRGTGSAINIYAGARRHDCRMAAAYVMSHAER